MSSVTRALAALLVLAAACGPSEWKPPALQDSHEDPAKIRPGFGNDALHAWWPLTPPELAALQNVDKARQGDAHALLALAILGSGDVRDAASYARYTKRFDDFVEGVRPSVEAEPDQAKRGDLLNRAMHKAFFTGAPNPKEPSIGSYDYDQPRVTGVFEHGTYNCISSALLYTALARAFGLPVRGVITKNHAFVELDPDGTDQRIDVEAGSYAALPKGVAHGLSVRGEEARLLITLAPAGAEYFFVPRDDSDADPAKFGLEIHDAAA